jgi:hypothetical protein
VTLPASFAGPEIVADSGELWMEGRGVGGLYLLSFAESFADGLESMEEEAGATGVDLVGGDQVHEVEDGVLELGAAGGQREPEAFAGEEAGSAVMRVLGGLAGWVVVVAEGLASEGGGAASSVICKLVGAEGADLLVLVVWVVCVVHGSPLPGVLFVGKV